MLGLPARSQEEGLLDFLNYLYDAVVSIVQTVEISFLNESFALVDVSSV